MLRLVSIKLKNFGPFKGTQTIDFPDNDGVVIVYGENGRGKTTLLNAIRYGLFGKVVGRGSRTVSVHQMGNWESYEDGEYGFEIELQMKHNGQAYKLNRTCKPRTGVVKPVGDNDYVQYVHLLFDGNVLGPEEVKAHLSRIMPEQVSRFFLFDGELLQEYEELLWEESEAALKIKSSIEKILGVPILTSARAHLSELLQQAQTMESKQAQKKQHTESIGRKIAELLAQNVLFDDEKKEAELRQDDLKKSKTSLEQQRKLNERFSRLLKEKEDLEEKCRSLEVRSQEKIETFKEHARSAWQTVLIPKVASLRAELQKRLNVFESKELSRHIALHQYELASKATAEKRCPICTSELSEAIVKKIHKSPVDGNSSLSETDVIEMRRVRMLLDSLQTFRAHDKQDVLTELIDDIGSFRAERATAKDRISEIDDTLVNIDEVDVRTTERDYVLVRKELNSIESTLSRISDSIISIKANIQKLEEKLTEIGGDDIRSERKRREIYSGLFELFSQAVSVYRESLRDKVSENSTQLFKLFSGDPDYDSLTINSNYGLSIKHRDRGEIPVRSAGYEHLIALSLMGALQRCSPLRGPIIMDSPAGRLDGVHKEKVAKSLTALSPQVLLLVFMDELGPTKAREYLKENLVGEYRLSKKTSTHTTIEKYLGE
jgi:DNA sulfur modification protein DndD